MDFVHYDLGQLVAGQTVEVALNTAANVLLLDGPNFEAYRVGRPHTYYGGWVTQSPYLIGVPSTGRWHIAINLGGAAGSIRSNARVLG